MTTTIARWWAPTLALALLAGCNKQKLIPNTKVADTPENQEVLRIVERYREAMERREAADVLALVHPTYADNAGTPEASDDLDYDGLKRVLSTRFRRTTRVRMRIEYQSLRIRGREAQVDAWIDATFVYQEPNATARWRRFTDYNRFRLLRDGQLWRFISGL